MVWRTTRPFFGTQKDQPRPSATGNDLRIPIPIQVDHHPSDSTVGRHVQPVGGTQRIAVDVGRCALAVVVVVAKDQVEVPVLVKVVLVYPLQYTSTGDVQVLPRVPKRALAMVVYPLLWLDNNCPISPTGQAAPGSNRFDSCRNVPRGLSTNT